MERNNRSPPKKCTVAKKGEKGLTFAIISEREGKRVENSG